ncbi:N-acetyltransferase [Patiriisocius marinistellae]|uniref:N-acetyltransferase n=1 Tax=Patiriisocius marinistellae TaxID=2494560 RepID=A0A5J4G331_9FLAO|nr:GNAT family N-acetyltransferase [Patiriisocius marinistellae]GEQ86701.1 N-acetyltransferase [Patiriisocius marinistellae]
MLEIKRTNSENLDFKNLVEKLDAYLAIKDGDDHAFYNQFNNIDALNHVIVVYKNNIAVGCGAIKKMDSKIMELKRMFTSEILRRKGIATIVLNALEKWSAELGFEYCILETGIRQTEAIRLYKKCGYLKVPNYAQYEGVVDSLCFMKKLNK